MDIDQLKNSPLFEGVTDEEIDSWASLFTETEMVAGSSLAKQDDFAYKFFVVLDGEVDVHRDFEFVARMGPGEHFGEVALVKGERRNARVTAHSRCRLACMMGWDFKQMLDDLPVVRERVEAAAAERTPDE